MDNKSQAARLSNGKVVHISQYGWYQEKGQHAAHGNLTLEEAAEAWKLCDARNHKQEAR